MLKGGVRTCVLVLGAHRSGTSALTRVISLLGAALPKNLMPPAPNNNEAGFWEPQDLRMLHDEMLTEAGSQWDDWRKLELGVLPPDRLDFYKSEIRRLIEEDFGDAPLFVLKDPRICRMVPLYQDILGGMGIEAKYVLIHRHPLAVQASLKARDDLPEACSQLLWLRHVLEAEKTTRGCPRTFLSYEALLADAGHHVHQLADALGVTWPEYSADTMAQIRTSLRQELQHQKVGGEALKTVALAFRWLEATWLALEEALSTGKEQSPKLQSIEQEFGGAEDTAARGDFSEASALAIMLAGEQIEIAVRDAQMATLDAALLKAGAAFTAEIAARDAQMATLDAALLKAGAAFTAEIAARDAQMAALDAELLRLGAEFEATCASLNGALDHARAESATARQQIETFSRSRSWRMTAPLRTTRKTGRGLIDRLRSYLPRFVGSHSP